MGISEIPKKFLSLLRRLMALPPGVHTLTIIKIDGTARGLVGWAVRSEKLEVPSE